MARATEPVVAGPAPTRQLVANLSRLMEEREITPREVAVATEVHPSHLKREFSIGFRERLGMNLRRLREEAGLSQEDLIRIADVHRTQISKYERGETEPQAEVLARLSRALGVTAEEFFAGIGWQQQPPRLVTASSAEDSAEGEQLGAAHGLDR